AKNIKATASTFPPSDLIDVAHSLTSLGTGEALVTVLNPKGIPTAVATGQILAPSSHMSTVDDAQYQRVIASSPISAKYATAINRESAHEMLKKKLDRSVEEEKDGFGWKEEADDFEWRKSGSRKSTRVSQPKAVRPPREPKGAIESALNSRIAQNVARQATRTVTQSIVRGIFGMLKGK
ncbi:MAG: double-strand break repair helicase HerA and related ATPase, partial [Acidobacteriota bacterium]|nr:double-strand break repair helicase HerA and related ATPase [Acidobacteriota bacterium]